MREKAEETIEKGMKKAIVRTGSAGKRGWGYAEDKTCDTVMFELYDIRGCLYECRYGGTGGGKPERCCESG